MAQIVAHPLTAERPTAHSLMALRIGEILSQGAVFDPASLFTTPPANENLWGRATLDGDGARYIEIPAFDIGADDDFAITWDSIRAAGATHCIAGGGGSNPRVQVNDTGSNNFALVSDAAGVTSFSGAMSGVADGQMYSGTLTRTGGVIELLIDGVSKGTSAGNTQVYTFTTLFNGFGFEMPSGGTAGNVTLQNLSTDDYVHYKIDEGSGTEVKAYDKGAGHYGTNLVTNGSGLADTTGWSGTTGIALSASTGNLRITRGDNLNQYAYQSIAVESGKTYLASFNFVGDSGNSNEYLDFRLGSTQGGLDYGRINVIDDPANVGAHQVIFTATSSAAFVNFYLRNGADGDWIEVGDISLREITVGAAPGAEYVGAEFITNGGFDTDSDWSLANQWTITGGQAVNPGSDGFDTLDQQFDADYQGTRFLITFTVVSTTGPVGVRLGNIVGASQVGQVTTVGTHTILASPINFGPFGVTWLRFVCDAGTGQHVAIDNVSCVEVKTGTITPDAAWTTQAAYQAEGGLYDPSNLATLFQERTGASATTSAEIGDPVGTVLDLSGNDNHITASIDGERPILRQSAEGVYYLEYDDVDDALSTGSIDFGTDCATGVVDTTAATITEGQTFATGYTIDSEAVAALLIDRDLSAAEETDLTAWLEGRAGLT